MGATKETTKYLGGEVEMTGKFFPDAEGEVRMKRITSMDLSFKAGDHCYNIHINVKNNNGTLVGEIMAGPKEIEALFAIAGVEA